VARRCIFCCGTPLTREHALPQWLNGLLGGAALISWGNQTDPATRRRSPKGVDWVTRSVCRECNNGWMSELEGAAAPVLEPLILGDVTRLSPDEQALVAIWVWKTFLMVELVQQVSPRVTRDEDYHWFFEQREPAQSACCWMIGWQRSAGRDWFTRYWSNPSHRFTHPSQRTLPPKREMSGYRATVAIGRVAFQIVADRLPQEGFGFVNGGVQDGLIFNIWPGFVAPALPWPPLLFVDEWGLQRFHNRLIGREIVSPARVEPLALPPPTE